MWKNTLDVANGDDNQTTRRGSEVVRLREGESQEVRGGFDEEHSDENYEEDGGADER